MAQVIRDQAPSAVLQRTARIAAILTVCVVVMAAVYVATLYLIAS